MARFRPDRETRSAPGAVEEGVQRADDTALLVQKRCNRWAKRVPWDVRDLQWIENHGAVADYEMRPNIAVGCAEFFNRHQRHDDPSD